MISFDDIDSRLAAIDKNRAWLAQVSGRALSSVRDALAPNADPSKRSEHLQRALTTAIEAEEARQASEPAAALQNLILEVGQAQFDAWNTAALQEGKLIRQWAIDGLDTLAEIEIKKILAPTRTGTET